MNSIVSSLFAFWITADSSNESATESTKQISLKTVESSGNLSNNLQHLQTSTSPRNNLQLVSSIKDVQTTYDHQQPTTTCCETIPQWRTSKVDNSLSSINSMQPNRDITGYVLKTKKQFSKRNINFDSSLNSKESGNPSSLDVNNFIVDETTLVRSMKSIHLETHLNGNANYSSNFITMKNQANDSASNFHLYSSLPISSMNHACYYEVTLLETSNCPTICLGFGKYDNDLQNHVGWFCESVAFHTDDQRLRNSQLNSSYRVGGPQIKSGDTIGVYWDLNSGMVYFTKNGEFIDYKTNCRVSNSNEFMIAMSGQVNGNSTLTFKLNVGNERFQCKHFNDLYHLSESQTKLLNMIDLDSLSDICITTTSL